MNSLQGVREISFYREDQFGNVLYKISQEYKDQITQQCIKLGRHCPAKEWNEIYYLSCKKTMTKVVRDACSGHVIFKPWDFNGKIGFSAVIVEIKNTPLLRSIKTDDFFN